MKKIIKKFWGVGLIVILLSTLFVGGSVPVANGATLAWGAAGIMPNNAIFNPGQIAAATDVSIIKVASNGDIFIVDKLATPDAVLKSVNGGRTWTACVMTAIGGTDTVDALVISPSYATDGNLYAVVNAAAGANVRVFQSVNAGISFGQLGVAISTTAGDIGTSIALDPTYNAGVGGVLVGLANNVAATYPANGTYTWVGAPTYSWLAVGILVEDVTSVAYSPNFPIDQAIIAVGSTAAGTNLHVKVFTNAWDAVSYYPATLISAAVDDIGGLGTGIVTSSLALPSDFNAAGAATRYLYASTSSTLATNDDVYRVYLVPGFVGGAGTAMAYATPKVAINNLSYSGNTASGILYAGAVLTPTFKYMANPSSVLSAWVGGGLVTGASNAYVAAVGGTVYVGTTGAESAFNTSVDGGANFWQTGYIDTVVSALVDFVPASASEWYMVTQRAATNNSLWKTTNGGVSWVRIMVLVGSTAANPAAVRISPDFATDGTMYLFEVGATAGAPVLQMSSNSGATWTQGWFPTAASAVGITDVVVVDKYTMYAGTAAKLATAPVVYRTSNNGFWWTTQTLTGATLATGVFQIKYDIASGDVLVGMSDGLVILSADGLIFTSVGRPTGATGNSHVAFDANYATNGMIYAGSDAGSVGTWRYTVSALTWFQISALIVAGASGDIYVTPDGVLYAIDATAATVTVGLVPAVGGMVRILAPTTGSAVLGAPAGEVVSGDDGVLLVGATLSSLAYIAGSNILYSVDTTANIIWTYTDTLTQAIPTIVSPAANEVVLAAAATVIITPVTGALNYTLTWNTREDWLGVGVAAVAFTPFPTNGFVLAGVPAGATIYYQVRITAPVLGPWSQVYSFVTQLAPAGAPNAPVINPAQPAANGGINVPLQPVFTWGAIAGATGYEFQLAKDAAMTDLVVDATGANALGTAVSYEYSGTLDYSTTYYWRVKGISGTSFTAWTTVQAFTTMAEPEPVITVEPNPTPTIIVPTPTVIVPTPTYTTISTTEVTEKINPSYIWAIIIIGAVLVIAVIVLIIRTRRPV